MFWLIAEGGDPMWQALIGLLGASPPAVAVIICVILFLKQMEKKETQTAETFVALNKEHRDELKTVVSNCTDVIRDNTSALRENAAALARFKS